MEKEKDMDCLLPGERVEVLYREKFKDLIKSFRNEFNDYIKLRNEFLQSFVPSERAEENDKPDEEDLLASLLKEMDLKEEGPKKNEKNKSYRGLFKKIIDKEKFKNYIEDFKKDFELYRTLLKDFYSEAYYWSAGSDDTEILELIEIIKGVYKGIIPVIILEQKLTLLYNKTENLLDRLDDCSEDNELSGVKGNLNKLKEAFLEVNIYFDKGNKTHLLRGLEGIENLSDVLIKANDIISLKEVEENYVICIVCGGRNFRGLQFCTACKAVLPFTEESASALDISETGEMTDQEDDSVQNEDVKYFKRLINRFINGRIEENLLKEFMGKFYQKIISTKKNFEYTLRPFLYKNPEVKELKTIMDGVLSVFDDFLSALDRGNKFFEDKNKAHLTNCLSSLIESDKLLQDFMKEAGRYMEIYGNKERSKYRTTRLPGGVRPE